MAEEAGGVHHGAVTLSGAKGLLDITISPLLQQNATAEEREAHIDIADWLMRSMGVGEYCHSEWQREKLLLLLRKRLRSLPKVLLTVPFTWSVRICKRRWR